ncbi:histone-lysine N-methyltransferase, H3 lysine-9 specific SUVH5-like [Andrographis paniculata]|uniref:histone-lysine N-methyltransferase, H3 lysine-9 specific SUVH5-like n=1 Tax=Andrographis paniculata TaxID=175694 RepID=UPI0021E87124|nr:histone-lysine N-methyltransferase, H3 lysine-9 specific SUVH5-like [Andrographis paniculata]
MPRGGCCKCCSDTDLPSRCVPTLNVQIDSGNSVATQRRYDGDKRKLRNDKESDIGSGSASWLYDLNNLSALIAEAGPFIDSPCTKHSAPEGITSEQSESSRTISSNSFPYSSLDGEAKTSAETTHQDQNSADFLRRKAVEERLTRACENKKLQRSVNKEKNDDDEGSTLSSEEWSMLQPRTKRKCGGHVLGSQGRFSESSEDDLDEKPRKAVKVKSSECSVWKKGQDGKASAECPTGDSTAATDYYDIEKDMAISGRRRKYSGSRKTLIDLNLVPYDHPQSVNVRAILKAFKEQCGKVTQKLKELGVARVSLSHHDVIIKRLRRTNMWSYPEKPFGHVAGVQIGDKFRFRAELTAVGVHGPLNYGIDYVEVNETKLATSVVNSGRYENVVKSLDVMIYSGEGCYQQGPKRAEDQKLEGGNLALMNSMKLKYPVRVCFKKRHSITKNEGSCVYVYDGLYMVNKMMQERDKHGKLVFKFEMHRMPCQPRPYQTNVKPVKQMKGKGQPKDKEVCIMSDISQGLEERPIRVINGVDNDRYPSFTYITKMSYPSWFHKVAPVGCNCTNGCSDSEQCACILKNRGEIPFNEKGEILRVKPLVHECGPLCKCPPSCMNRVSQRGPRYQLEIFKTESRGWGVRSRHYISSGSFICEYVGELLRDKEAEQRINNDEYLFDLGGDGEAHDSFSIDALKFGNVSRFINHSCSPNLLVQNVLYDHNDKKVPHIMFFATKNIPPSQELFYDYNYKMGLGMLK